MNVLAENSSFIAYVRTAESTTHVLLGLNDTRLFRLNVILFSLNVVLFTIILHYIQFE